MFHLGFVLAEERKQAVGMADGEALLPEKDYGQGLFNILMSLWG